MTTRRRVKGHKTRTAVTFGGLTQDRCLHVDISLIRPTGQEVIACLEEWVGLA